jgi:hypothetical protein
MANLAKDRLQTSIKPAKRSAKGFRGSKPALPLQKAMIRRWKPFMPLRQN